MRFFPGFPVAVSLLGLALAGCQLVLGDYRVDPPPVEEEELCETESALRCDGQKLLVCPLPGAKWALIEECASGFSCSVEMRDCVASGG